MNRREFSRHHDCDRGHRPGQIASAEASQKLTNSLHPCTGTFQLGAGANVFAAEIAKRTAGRFIEQFPNSALGGEVEMLKAMQTGTIDMAFITGRAAADRGARGRRLQYPHPRSATRLTRTPRSTGRSAPRRSQASRARTCCSRLGRERHAAHHQFQAADCDRGRHQRPRLRLPQSDVMMAAFKAMGADVSALAFPQLYTALQTGQLDGQEIRSPPSRRPSSSRSRNI